MTSSQTTSRDLAKAFFDAIIAVSYINDPVLRDKAMSELVETNKLIRTNSQKKLPPMMAEDHDPELERRH